MSEIKISELCSQMNENVNNDSTSGQMPIQNSKPMKRALNIKLEVSEDEEIIKPNPLPIRKRKPLNFTFEEMEAEAEDLRNNDKNFIEFNPKCQSDF